MEFLSVDRIEKDHIICEDERGRTHVVPLKELPVGLKEGNVVAISKEGKITTDIQKTRIRKNTILNLRRKIYIKDKKLENDF